MLFWLILHSLQLSGAEATEPGFSGKKSGYQVAESDQVQMR